MEPERDEVVVRFVFVPVGFVPLTMRHAMAAACCGQISFLRQDGIFSPGLGEDGYALTSTGRLMRVQTLGSDNAKVFKLS